MQQCSAPATSLRPLREMVAAIRARISCKVPSGGSDGGEAVVKHLIVSDYVALSARIVKLARFKLED